MASSRLLIVLVTATILLHQTTSQSGFNYQTCKKDWDDIGCRIGFHRSLKILHDDRKPNAAMKINWDNVNGYVNDLMCRCKKLAAAASYQWFAIEKSGICLSGAGALATYLRSHPVASPGNVNCTGVLTQVPQRAPDGAQCILGGYRAYFHEIKKSTGGDVGGDGGGEEATAGEEGEATAAPPTEKACSKVSDVVVVIDGSGSVTEAGFKLVKEFLRLLVARFTFGVGKSRLAMFTYANYCTKQLDWNQSNNLTLSQHNDEVNSLPYDGGSTRTDLGLECAEKMILAQQRPNIPKTVCVITDGRSWNGKKLVPAAVQKLKNIANLRMVAIGVGDANQAELDLITGNQKSHTFLLKNFKDLLSKAIVTLNGIIKTVCV